MRVYLLPRNPPLEQFLDLTGEDYHYLARVRRLRVGDRFPGSDGGGGCWMCTVLSVGSTSLRLQLERSYPVSGPAQPSIHLIQCLPKAAKMDLIIRQVTEAGVQRVIPVFSRFTQVRFSSSHEAENKMARWRRVARQAVQQSGAAGPPVIDTPRDLQTVLQELEAGSEEIRLYFHQDREECDSLHSRLSKNAKIVTLVVGPEGGLSTEERDLLRKKLFLPITLGFTVLRTETAALYAVAAVQTVIYERNEWEPT